MLYIFVGIKPEVDKKLHEKVKAAYRAVYNLLGHYSASNHLDSYVKWDLYFTFVDHKMKIFLQNSSRLNTNPNAFKLAKMECAFRDIFNKEIDDFHENRHVTRTLRELHK